MLFALLWLLAGVAIIIGVVIWEKKKKENPPIGARQDNSDEEETNEPQTKCPECGKEIEPNTQECPHCGFPMIKIGELKKEKTTGNITLAVIVLIVGIVVWSCITSKSDKSTKTNESPNTQSESNKGNEKSSPKKSKKKPKSKPRVKKKASNSKLSESAYKAKCKKLYHNDVFFGKKDLEGKLVKADVFVKNIGVLDLYSTANQELYDKWKVKRTLYICSVKRKKSNSYASPGEFKVYFSGKKGYKVNDSGISDGSKFTVYGEVIDWSDNTWEGYNDVSLVARFIERR